MATVSGGVTFEGQPLPTEILFEPLDESRERRGRPSSATTDANGNYRLDFTTDQAGAIVGWHRVTIKVTKPITASVSGNSMHSWFQLKTVHLTRQVRDGHNQFNFILTL